jgi:hypothetical protein
MSSFRVTRILLANRGKLLLSSVVGVGLLWTLAESRRVKVAQLDALRTLAKRRRSSPASKSLILSARESLWRSEPMASQRSCAVLEQILERIGERVTLLCGDLPACVQRARGASTRAERLAALGSVRDLILTKSFCASVSLAWLIAAVGCVQRLLQRYVWLCSAMGASTLRDTDDFERVNLAPHVQIVFVAGVLEHFVDRVAARIVDAVKRGHVVERAVRDVLGDDARVDAKCSMQDVLDLLNAMRVRFDACIGSPGAAMADMCEHIDYAKLNDDAAAADDDESRRRKSMAVAQLEALHHELTCLCRSPSFERASRGALRNALFWLSRSVFAACYRLQRVDTAPFARIMNAIKSESDRWFQASGEIDIESDDDKAPPLHQVLLVNRSLARLWHDVLNDLPDVLLENIDLRTANADDSLPSISDLLKMFS